MMKERNIYINSINKAKQFSQAAINVSTDVLVKSLDRKYCIDGKSILGIFSLDLSKEVTVFYHEEETKFEEYLKTLAK